MLIAFSLLAAWVGQALAVSAVKGWKLSDLLKGQWGGYGSLFVPGYGNWTLNPGDKVTPDGHGGFYIHPGDPNGKVQHIQKGGANLTSAQGGQTAPTGGTV